MDGIQRQIRIDGTGAVAEQGSKMMYFPRFSRFQDDGEGGTLFRLHQMLMNGGDSQKRRDRHMIFIDAAVGQDKNICPFPVRTVHFHKETVDRPIQRGALVVGDRDRDDFETVNFHVFDLQHIRVGQDRIVDLQYLTVDRLFLQQISVTSHIYAGGGDDLFPDGVNGRIGHLSKQLFEVIEQRLMLMVQYGEGRIHTHGADSFGAIQRHISDGSSVFLVCISECFLQSCPFLTRVFLHRKIGDFQILQFHQVAVQPFSVRLAVGVSFFQFVIVDDFSLNGIHQKHFSGMKAFFDKDLVFRNIQHADL